MNCAMLGALLAAIAPIVANGQPIHRCAGAHGEIVFSGLACAAGASTSAPTSRTDAALPTLSADTCPTSRDELRDRIMVAIARRDANALATLLRWRGVGASAASGRMRTLRDLARRPLLAMDGGDDLVDGAGDASASEAAEVLRVRTGSNQSDGVREHRFSVRVEGTCHWLVW